MLRKIKLYGELAEFVGHKEFEVKADTLAHAVSFLVNNFEGIDRFMNPKHYQVKIGSYAVDQSELSYPVGQEDIHFIPVITGAGRGFGKILLGAALIGLAFIPFAGAGTGLGAAFKGGFSAAKFAKVGFISKGLAGLGTALVLQGVSDMLFPVPEVPEFESEENPRLSFSFGGTQQTGRAGTPVPLVYGEIFTGSVVISGSIDTEQVQA
jgi:predicted phage tail protein